MPVRPPVPSSVLPLRLCSFGRSFLLPVSSSFVPSPRRVRAAMAAASARWPAGVWVRRPASLALLLPDGSCGLLVSWGSGRRVW